MGSEFAGVCAGQVEDVDVGVLGCDAAGDDVALGDDSLRAAGNVEEGDAGGVELLSGFCNGGVFGELIASHRVGGEKRCVAALFSLGRVGVELVEQDAVDFGGVFGVHPVGVGSLVLVRALLVVALLQRGELLGGCGFGGPGAARQDCFG